MANHFVGDEGPTTDERYESKKARSKRPTAEDRIEEKKARSQRPASRAPEDHKESEENLEGMRREALDERGLFTAYYGEEGEEIEVEFDPDNFNIEFQLIAEQGRPATALQYVIGDDEMKKFLRKDPKELNDIIQSLAKQCGKGKS